MMQNQNLDPNQAKVVQGLYSQIEASTKSIKDNITDVGAGLKTLIDNVSKFDNALITTSRSLGQSVLYAQSLETRFGKVAEQIIKIGGDADDVVEIFKTMSAEIGRTVDFSDQALINMAMLKRVGVADESIKSFTKLFDTIGGTFDEATTQQMMLVNQAKSYGLNVGQFMTGVASQLSKINQYGFPNGVKDLGEMVAKSKMLGVNIEVAQGFADKLMGSPEAAMDVAAQLQTLGGSFASLGDPMELLYLAQNDLSGLNDKLIDATKGLATFNKETGQFEIGVNERLRIKQAANAFGTDSSKIIESATRIAKQQEIIKQFDMASAFKGLDNEQREVLASFAQIGKGGQVTIEGKGLNEFIAQGPGELNKLLAKLQGAGNQFQIGGEGAVDENIKRMQENASAVEKASTQTTLFDNALSLATIQGGKFTDVLNDASNIFGGVLAAGSDLKSTFGSLASEKFTKAVGNITTGTDTTTASVVLQGISDKFKSIELPSLTLKTVDPIKITIDSSFNIDAVVRDALQKAVTQKIKDEVNLQLNASKPSGAKEAYSSGESK